MFLTIKPYLYLNYVLMLNGITVLFDMEQFWHVAVCKQNLYLY